MGWSQQRLVAITALSLLAIALALAAIIRALSPFSRSAVTTSLQQAFSTKVEIAKLRSTYFPHPGCVAEDITLRFGDWEATPARIQQLTSLLGDRLDARREQLRTTLPIGRVVGPADIAALAVHLMTNTAVTGATYDIDGGQQLVEG